MYILKYPKSTVKGYVLGRCISKARKLETLKNEIKALYGISY